MEYFQSSRNLNLAVSIVTTGTGVGLLLISPLAGFFIVEYGWRTCYLLFGLISALICVFTVLIVKNPRRGAQAMVEKETSLPGLGTLEAMKTRNLWSMFGVYTLGSGIGRSTVLVYLVVFLVAAGLPFQAGAVCLGLVGGGTVLGRIASGLLSGRLRESRIMSASYLFQGLSTIAFLLSGNIWLVYSAALIFGIAYGGYVTQCPMLVKDSYGMKSYGLIYGVILSGLGIGSLIGPPILERYSFGVTGNYFLTFVLSGVFSLVAGAIALFVKTSS
jgi:predicted MFS family arabinose efflux permease